jgi:small conductance mechanosensitive channel
LNLEKTIATALAGAGIVGLALAFAFQDIAANFISGVFISFNKPFHLREVIRVNDIEGVVISIQLRTTTLRTSQGLLVIIPNKNVIQNPIINYTRLGRRRADVKGGVSQGDDLRKVQRVALEALKNVPGVIEKDTTLLFDNLGESTIDFTVRIWLNSGDRTTYDQFLSEVIITLKEAFDANGISLPFPIRTLDFAMKGGEKLSDMTLNIVKKEAN